MFRKYYKPYYKLKLTPYFIIFAILAFCSLFDVFRIKPEQRTIAYVLIWFMLWIFAGFRSDIFPDYQAYSEYFSDLREGVDSVLVATEPGFIVINTVIGWFTDNSTWLFIAMAITAVTINLKSYRDYTPFYFIAILAYFSHTFLGREMMQIRAGVAAAIALYSYRFIITSKLKKFIFFIIIAATIHLGALVVLVMYPIIKLNFKPRAWLFILAVCLYIGLAMPLGSLLRQLPEVALLERVQVYSSDERYSGDLGIFNNPTLLKQLMISIIGLSFFKTLSKRCYGYNVFLTSYLIATCWLILWNDFAILSARIATFFSITEVLLLAMFTCLFEKKSRPIYLLWVILLTFAMLLLNTTKEDLPSYQMIFQSTIR